jgi:glutathione S-transferase
LKLYSFSLAPNARRVIAFLHEKGIKLDVVELNARNGEQLQEPYKSMNTFNCIPFLELNDGTVISECLSICRYLEGIYPSVPLFGESNKEQAIVDMWCRRIELDALTPLFYAVRNTVPSFKDRVLAGSRIEIKQEKIFLERAIDMINLFFSRVEKDFSGKEFICGNFFSVADISGFFVFSAMNMLKIEVPDDCNNVKKWRDKLFKRKSLQFD